MRGSHSVRHSAKCDFRTRAFCGKSATIGIFWDLFGRSFRAARARAGAHTAPFLPCCEGYCDSLAHLSHCTVGTLRLLVADDIVIIL